MFPIMPAGGVRAVKHRGGFGEGHPVLRQVVGGLPWIPLEARRLLHVTCPDVCPFHCLMLRASHVHIAPGRRTLRQRCARQVTEGGPREEDVLCMMYLS